MNSSENTGGGLSSTMSFSGYAAATCSLSHWESLASIHRTSFMGRPAASLSLRILRENGRGGVCCVQIRSRGLAEGSPARWWCVSTHFID